MRQFRSCLWIALLSGIMVAVTACGSGGGGGDAGSDVEEYPSKDIRLIVQAEAGGPSDLNSRTAAGTMEKELGTNIVVENMPGAAGTIAHRFVADQNPDGYTIGLMPVEVAFLQYEGYDVKPEDYDFICELSAGPTLLAVQDDSPYKTFEDFIAAAKENPGQLDVANSGAGSSYHAATGALEQGADIELSPVPFDGGAPAAAALTGGQVDAATVSTAEAVPGVEAGDLRVLAVFDDKRSPQLQDVPTAKELGYDVQPIVIWIGLGAPAGTPKPVIDELAKACKTAVESENFQRTIRNAGYEPTYKGPEEFTEYVQSEAEKYAEIIPKLELREQ